MKVETEELLSIGRFARLSGLTVKALRHYDELGLFRPAHVDEWTGYRYYAAAQARDAIAIRRLREVELPLEEIAFVLGADEETLRERLAVHRARLEGHVSATQRLLGRLDRLIEGKEPLVPETTIEAKVQRIPAVRVAVIAARVPVDDMFTFVPESLDRVAAWLFKQGLSCTGQPMTMHLGIEDDALDAEVGWPLEHDLDGDEVISVRSYPPARAAVYEHHGSYEGLPAVYGPLEDWIREHDMTPGTPIRETYLTNPGHTSNPDEFRTQVAWPLA